MRISKKINYAVLIAALCAVTLQIQLTLFKTESYDGLRIGLADFFIFAITPIALLNLTFKKDSRPGWLEPFHPYALVLMSAIIIFAFINGYLIQGSLSQWALVNKFCGWFVLMAYFGTAAWLSVRYINFVPAFIKTFIVFAIFTMAGEVLIQILRIFEIETGLRHDHETISGFMANRNVFAFLITVTSVLVTFKNFKNPGISLYIFWFLFGPVFLFNSARILWLCMPLLLIAFAVFDLKKTLKIILPSLVAGIGFFFVAFTPAQKAHFITLPYKTTNSLIQYMQKPDDPVTKIVAESYGNLQRINILKAALELFQQHPLQGAGLGSALHFQEKLFGKRIDVIDSTPIWIVTEMGIAGFLIFAGSYLLMFIALLRASKENADDIMPRSVLLILLCFGIFSLAHELLYTRFLWFILGLALAVPRTHPAQPKS